MSDKLGAAILEQITGAIEEIKANSQKVIDEEKSRLEAEKAKRDIFDELDVFDSVDENSFKPYVAPPRVEVKITDEIRALIAEQVKAGVAEAMKGMKPETKVIEKTINNPTKVIVKEMIDNSAQILKEAEKRIKKEIDDLDKSGRFGPIVVPSPIADQNGNGGKVLSTDGSKTKWIAATSGGGSSTDAYVANSVTTTRTYDATLTSLDEIASVLGSLIKSLQGAGIIQ